MTKIWVESGNVKLVQALAIEQKDDIMHSPNNPPLLPDHFKLKMDGISSGKWTEIDFVCMREMLSSCKTGFIFNGWSNCPGLKFKLFALPDSTVSHATMNK